MPSQAAREVAILFLQARLRAGASPRPMPPKRILKSLFPKGVSFTCEVLAQSKTGDGGLASVFFRADRPARWRPEFRRVVSLLLDEIGTY